MSRGANPLKRRFAILGFRAVGADEHFFSFSFSFSFGVSLVEVGWV
jgi:hypothetical protein